MKKSLNLLSILCILIAVIVPTSMANAMNREMQPMVEPAKEETTPVVEKDIHAIDNAKKKDEEIEHEPVITEDKVHGIGRMDIIHYKRPKSITDSENSAVTGTATSVDTCSKILGPKWSNLPVKYTINPANPQGLSSSFITSAISKSAETWDSSTSKELFNNVYGIDYNAKYRVLDYKNSIVFGSYSDSNVIAITTVWYSLSNMQIFDSDILFNTYYKWGNASQSSSVMDLQNIATHELGHFIGLGDIYDSTCSQVTMYGYSSYGQTLKRTLDIPDIYGLQKIYG